MTDNVKIRILNETFKDFHHARRRTIGYCSIHVKGGSSTHPTTTVPPLVPVFPPCKAVTGKKELMVPGGRVELPLSCENRILSPARLPVPPSGHGAIRAPLLT